MYAIPEAKHFKVWNSSPAVAGEQDQDQYHIYQYINIIPEPFNFILPKLNTLNIKLNNNKYILYFSYFFLSFLIKVHI